MVVNLTNCYFVASYVAKLLHFDNSNEEMGLSYHLCEFRLGTDFAAHNHVNDGGGLFAIKATALHGEFVFSTIGRLTLANGRGCAERELIAGASSIEDSLLRITDWPLCGILRLFLDLSLFIAILFQKTVEFFLGSGHTGRTQTIAFCYLSFWQRLLQRIA